MSAALMFRRLTRAPRYAVREEDYLTILSAAVALVVRRLGMAFVAVRAEERDAE